MQGNVAILSVALVTLLVAEVLNNIDRRVKIIETKLRDAQD
jgi:hypothetical protein